MYLVAAISEQPGPPAFPARQGRTPATSSEPIGIQHAVPRLVGAKGTRHAICGADVGGWVILRDRRFVTSSGATCQRCAQLAASAAEER